MEKDVVFVHLIKGRRLLQRNVMKFYYLGFYAPNNAKIGREFFPAEVTKMKYIAKVLQCICPQTEIVSYSLPKGKRFFYPSENSLSDGINVHFFPFSYLFSHPKFNDRWRSFCLFIYGLFHFTSSDLVVSYHENSFTSRALIYLRRIKKFKVILEVEEIYADLITKFAAIQLQREILAFENSDGYIFSTDLLAKKINKRNLPSVTIYGTYQKDVQPHLKVDDKIHVIYAGIFAPRKGSMAAAESICYLPKNYSLHICGYGSEEETELIKSVIHNLREKGHNVCYEGLLKGQNYLDMLHRCQIGLSPQDPDAKFNNTSFPSKILSYMSAGLAVVSIDIPAIKNSKVGEYINFYELQTPEEIAKCIVNCDISQGERNKEVIASLDADFKEKMRQCIQMLQKA